jgi:hypothetical protein
MGSSGMLRHLVVTRTDVSEELSASIIRTTRVGELGIILAITSTLMMDALSSSESRFLQEPHDATCQKTQFFGIK